MRARRGFTLVEILIATVVLACFLTLIGTVTAKAYAYYVQSDRIMSSYRSGSVQMELLRRQLQQTVQLLSPSAITVFTEGANVTPAPGTPVSICYETWDGTGNAPALLVPSGVGSGLWLTGINNPKQVAWQYNSKAKTLETFPCEIDGLTRTGPVRTVVTNVSAFSFTHVPRASNNNMLVVQAQLTVQTDKKTFNFNIVAMPRSLGNGI